MAPVQATEALSVGPAQRHPQPDNERTPRLPPLLRNLANNSSPDQYAAGPLKQVASTRLSMQRGFELAATLPWESKNVDRFAYSNSNCLALGQLIEKLRGRPVADVLNQDTFGPLGLQHTSPAEPDRWAPDTIHAYIIDGSEQVDATQPEALVGSPQPASSRPRRT